MCLHLLNVIWLQFSNLNIDLQESPISEIALQPPLGYFVPLLGLLCLPVIAEKFAKSQRTK